MARDPHRFANDLPPEAIERLIARLEGRVRTGIFGTLFEKYAARLTLTPESQLLEVGCGTGAVLRAIARRGDIQARLIGVDQCPPFIEAAQRFAQHEQISDRLEFRVGDVHALDFPGESFDAVIVHTLISHVTEPAQALREITRVTRRGGSVVIFDGDYASLTYAYHDHTFGHRMDTALANAAFNNPRIMRDLPRLLPDFELSLLDAWGDAVVEIGRGDYFKSFAETYAPYVIDAGILPKSAVSSWMAAQRQAMQRGTFLASCNYYTFLAQRRS